MLQILMILSFICSLDLLSARPAEEPIKFTFDNIRNNTENTIPSKSEERKEILEHVADAIRIGQGRFINLIILTRNIIANRAKSRRSIPPIRSTTPIILFPPMEQETIRLENETAQAILERRKPDNIRQLLNRFLTPKPLVDRIKEEEKYGNTGDKFTGVEKAVINGYENFSNFLNLLTDFPVGIAKQTSRGITEILNELGARIIGLQ
ncbi:uncharacterized protein LOC105837304 isoform X3 [Monomorium pharaonis]|uniref:uncharacterized protein LOC105837304 isoform X3 n=1 Tax=Monomorium pharaonis TaxID=307658 RepID=UPI0017460F6A|nr:uncharacterized protein LOC105837304 isoform X3 [Monomorium pharaonis]